MLKKHKRNRITIIKTGKNAGLLLGTTLYVEVEQEKALMQLLRKLRIRWFGMKVRKCELVRTAINFLLKANPDEILEEVVALRTIRRRFLKTRKGKILKEITALRQTKPKTKYERQLSRHG